MVPDINLLPKRERQSASVKWLFIAIAVIFCAFLLFLLYRSITLSSQLTGLKSEQQSLEIEKETLLEKLSVIDDKEAFDLETAVEFVERVSYPVSPLIIEINKGLDEDAYLREYAFTETAVQLRVDFETMPEVVSYVDYLSRSNFFEDVFVNEMTAFDPVNEEDKSQFNVVDRFANSFELPIRLQYLRADGD
ncbi:PilN domain-containing protein [Sporosarcina ureilytica]|uniref:Fimbrial assembly protein n=1 Tax=Sporosarcina ureilytica TaxID=298596 RepID=A0A1D8JFW3_9BACL|nr:hypothetical protein [Sporosarcina ureilytica]AOV07601.1 hypothetical protein BI350_08680 [Sporosarcina ureilytica]